jgi:hypothetical protein
MDHVTIRQIVRASYDGLARPDGRERSAFRIESRARGPVDDARHAATGAQLGVGCVDDGVHVRLVCDVAADALEGHAMQGSLGHEFSPPPGRKNK